MVVIVSLHLQLFFCSSFSLGSCIHERVGVDYCDFQVTAWLQLVFFFEHEVACVVSKHSLCHCVKRQCEPSKRICVETKIPAATTAGNPCLSNYWYHQGWWNAFVVVRTSIFRGGARTYNSFPCWVSVYYIFLSLPQSQTSWVDLLATDTMLLRFTVQWQTNRQCGLTVMGNSRHYPTTVGTLSTYMSTYMIALALPFHSPHCKWLPRAHFVWAREAIKGLFV